jgi:hypothetical protein
VFRPYCHDILVLKHKMLTATAMKRPSSDNTASDTNPSPSKRQHKESNASKTTSTMPSVRSATIKQAYQRMLPDRPQGVSFLFTPRFTRVLQQAAESVAIEYQITKEDALEEFRRMLVIKAFIVDTDATKIGPTPLSKPVRLLIFLILCSIRKK